MWIVDDELDASLPLPRGECDIPLMIADRSFDRHNQLTDPFSDGLRPPADGDRRQPRPRQRRPPAAPPGRRPGATGCGSSTSPSSAPTTSHLSNGAQMTQIATDSGLMPRPVRRREILLGPAERAEVVVDFSGAAGESVELRSGARARRTRTGPALRRRADAVPGRSGGDAEDGTRVPRRLRPLPRLDASTPRRSRTAPGRSRSAAASCRSGRSTAGPSTRPAPTPSRGSARPRPGRSSTAPPSPT